MIASALLTTSAATAWAALGWSVIHFLWQGTLIGLCTAVLLDALPRREASARYLLAFGALLACLLAFVATLCLLMPTSAPSSSADAALQAASFSHLPPLAISLLDVPAIAAWCWSLGVLCMSMRFARHWMWTRRLETESILVPDEQWQQLFRSIKRELGVDRAVRFLQSTLVDTPMVVGWIAPAVLIPVSAFSALTPGQLRSLLAHGLAHIRRHDHLLNLLQCAIESLLSDLEVVSRDVARRGRIDGHGEVSHEPTLRPRPGRS